MYHIIIMVNTIIYTYKEGMQMNYTNYFKNEEQIQKAISNAILKIRTNNNLTQQKLAEILDVSIEHISRIENCKYTCSITLIFKLCSIFNLSIDEFFEIEKSENDSISNFFKNLSLEKRSAIVEFCKQIETNYSSDIDY